MGSVTQRASAVGLTVSGERPALPPGPYLVIGLGAAGAAAVRALLKHGSAPVRAWDSAADQRQRGLARELRGLGAEVWAGGDWREALGDAATVVKSPGVPWDIAVVAEAERLGLEVVDEFEIGWRLVPAPTVGVTGTNGKSTVAALCVAVLEGHGLRPVLAGNTEFGPPLSELSLGESPRSVVAEVSSYQSEACPRLQLDGAIFTSLIPDHLNRHGSMAEYAAAKRRLFVKDGSAVPVAALNVDYELGRRLAAEVEMRGGRSLTYGNGSGAEYRVRGCHSRLTGAVVELDTPGGVVELTTKLPGRYNASNVAGVLALADGLDLDRDVSLEAISGAARVPGRFEVIDAGRPFDVVVDYGYTDVAVAAVIGLSRELVRSRGGRVVVVLGVPGRTGPWIAHQVGATAREAADHLILSATSYRGEPRMVTLAKLLAGARSAGGAGLEVVIDRREAIARGFELAEPGDLLLLLGRGPLGHEATDRRGGGYPLDDRVVAREIGARCASS